MNDLEPWWLARRAELLGHAAEASPAYVYDRASLDCAAAELASLGVFDRLLYAVKANPHPEILRRFAALGLGFECVSPGEIERVLQSCPEVSPDRILFTPNFAPRREYEQALETGVHLTLDSLHPLLHWQESLARREVFVRLDLGRGAGHHSHVRTAGAHSKFGIPREEWEELAQLARRADVRIVGLHSHAGSGILDSEVWRQTALDLADATALFAEVTVLDLGGGLGVPDQPNQPQLDLRPLAEALRALDRNLETAGRRFQLWLEPGRYLVAEAGVLLATVTQVKGKGENRYVGVDTGMNSLIRPMLYGAHQEIVNLTRQGEPPTARVTIVGPICETGDVLGVDRLLPETREGDVLLIATAGAYGHSMSSHYNLREPAREVVI
ncbi:MAG TPA: diaminopimelate decarboxylase [Thermoanaerobaculia bacterium]|nr:diaminopimelate decarboxylase [Thermoanaerobaculia bacterium]